MKPNQNASASLSVQNPEKHSTFLMQTSQNCVHICKCPPYQNTTLSLSVHYIKTLHFPYQNCVHICKCPPFHKHYAFLMKIASIFASVPHISKHYTFLITYSSVHYIKTLHFPYHTCNCPLYQNTTLSLSKLRPYFLSHIQVSTISKHYTFLIKIASIFLITYSSVHYIKTLHFPYQNCVHISYHIFKCPLYQNTTLSLSKLRPYFLSHMQVSTISQHYTFLIKIASIFLITYASVHHITTLHFSYTNMPKLRP